MGEPPSAEGPQARPAAARDASPDTPPDALRGKRVLVVEDEWLLAHDLVEGLGELGVEVVGPVAFVADALALIAAAEEPSGAPRGAPSRALDAAVLDIGLLDGEAYAVCDALRSRGVPFVFLTGYGIQDLPPAYRNAPHCEKPADVRAVARLLAQQA